MRSIDEVRASKVKELHSIIARPGMWAADGRAIQTVAMRALGDLCFIDDRDDEYTRATRSLYLYGKVGVVGAFKAVFGDDCNYVAEVASVFAQLAVGLGYLGLDRRCSEGGWRAFDGEVLASYGERDVRLAEIQQDLGPPSLLIGGRVLCYVGPDPRRWVVFDCWEAPLRTYVAGGGHFRNEITGDPLVRDIRVPAATFNGSLILTPWGKVLRWGESWWLRPEAGRDDAAPDGVVAQLRAINDGDPSQSLGPRRPWG